MRVDRPLNLALEYSGSLMIRSNYLINPITDQRTLVIWIKSGLNLASINVGLQTGKNEGGIG